MAVHPTIMHAVADVRRYDLLAEAEAASRASAGGPWPVRARVRQAVYRALALAEEIASRIVDDFEAAPGKRGGHEPEDRWPAVSNPPSSRFLLRRM